MLICLFSIFKFNKNKLFIYPNNNNNKKKTIFNTLKSLNKRFQIPLIKINKISFDVVFIYC